MTFTFTHDARELYRAYNAVAVRQPAYRALLVAFFLLPIAAIVRDVMVGASVADALKDNLVWLIVLPAWVLFGIPFLYRLGARRALARYPTLQGAQTIEVTDEGVRTANERADHTVGWEVVQRVVETPEFFFIYTSPRRALHIPRRAVRDADLQPLRALFRAKLSGRARLMGPAKG